MDKFQGREKKTIILSTVDNEISSFSDDPNRLNVAVSRAVDQLFLLVHGNNEKGNTNIHDLIQYVEYNDEKVVNSKICSVFDYLFKCYAEQRKARLKGKELISEYDSENLMYYEVICPVLRQERFSRYDVHHNYPLEKIFGNFDDLDPQQKEYVTHTDSHVDFLIFNRFGHIPVLAIEVDGVSFHAPDSKQGERDRTKDEIFKKIGIPLIRFRTDESGEREKLEKALMDLKTP